MGTAQEEMDAANAIMEPFLMFLLIAQMLSNYVYMAHWAWGMMRIFKLLMAPHSRIKRRMNPPRMLNMHTIVYWIAWIGNFVMAGVWWAIDYRFLMNNTIIILLTYAILPAIMAMLDVATYYLRMPWNGTSWKCDLDDIANDHREEALERLVSQLYKEIISPNRRGTVTSAVEVSLERTEC
jgi:hypothetical protein